MTEYLTVSEIAERLKVQPLTVRRWLNNGALTGIQLGDRAGWRITEDDLREFLEARTSRRDPDMGKAAA